MDAERSVRIELDDSTPGGPVGAPGPVAASPRPGKRAMVVGGLVVVAVVALGLFAFRPAEGDTADGTQRQTPTTPTVSPNTSSLPAAPAVTVPTPSLAPFFGSDVVRGSDGFLGLLASGSVGAFPSLYQSVDGIDWERVEVEVPPISAVGVDFVDYSSLIAAGGQNFAILRTGFSNEGQAPRRVPIITERLVSADGVRWVRDGAFTAVDHRTPATPSFHLSNAFGFSVGSVVFEETSGVGCEALLNRTTNPFTNPQLIHRFSRTLPSELEASSGVSHTQLSEARIASFTSNEVSVETLNACGVARGDLPDTRVASIEVIAPDETVRQIPLPSAVIVTGALQDGPEPPLFGAGDELLALFGTTVWQLNIETEEWARLLELAIEPALITDYQIVDERFVVGLGESMIFRADLELGEVAIDRVPEGATPAPEILYADSEAIITASLDVQQSTTVIPLPTAPLSEAEGRFR